MKIVSWNVNGIRALSKKAKDGTKDCPSENNTLRTLISEHSPDIICLQEIKTQNAKDLKEYSDAYPHIYTNHSKARKGYSGVAILSQKSPNRVTEEFEFCTESDLGIAFATFEPVKEGRMLTAFYDNCIVISVYTPNSKDELTRLGERLEWDRVFRKYITILEKTMSLPVIVCGDLNCAFHDIDIHNPKTNRKSAGFSEEERTSFGFLLTETKMVDSFRQLNPATVKYSYWSALHRARERNAGWRIDYLLVSDILKTALISADVLTDYYGSDHCPVLVDINIH
jgi:exodeoxyribonuclease III